MVALVAAACADDPQVAKRKFVESGDRYMAQQKYAEAIIQYRNAIAKDPKYGEARFKLGKALETTGDLPGSFRELIRAADLLPNDVNAQLAAGQRLLLQGQYPEASARARKILDKNPQDVTGLILMGNAMAGLKEFDKAVTQLEGAIAADPKGTLWYANLGLVQMARGDQQAAENVFKKAVDVQPDSASAHQSLANFYWAANRIPEAETELKKALELDPKGTSVMRGLAALYSQNGRPAEAERYLKANADVSKDVPSRVMLADFYLHRKDYASATPVLNQLAEDKDGFVPANLRLAAVAYDSGSTAKAYQLLDDVLRHDAANETAQVLKGQFLLSDGRATEALAIATKVLDANAQSVKGQFLKGSALQGSGSLETALKTFQDLQAQAPGDIPTQLKVAELQMLLQRYPEAIELTTNIIKRDPSSTQAHMLLATAALNQGNVAKAESELAQLVKNDPNSPDVQNLVASVHWRKGNRAAARDAYSRALQLKPDSFIALAGLVRADMIDNKPEAAIARLQPRLASHPNDISLQILAGTVYMASNNLQDAEKAFLKAIEIDQANLEAFSRLGTVYLRQNKLDEARRNYEDIAKKQSKPVAATTMVGIILTLQNKPTEARKEYERALTFDPQAAVAANNLAWEYAQADTNLDMALQLAQTAKQKLPTNAEVSDTLGWVYYKKNLGSAAVSAFRQGIEQDPANPNIHYHLGLAYMKTGDRLAARRSLEQALKLNPTFPGADDAKRSLETLK